MSLGAGFDDAQSRWSVIPQTSLGMKILHLVPRHFYGHIHCRRLIKDIYLHVGIADRRSEPKRPFQPATADHPVLAENESGTMIDHRFQITPLFRPSATPNQSARGRCTSVMKENRDNAICTFHDPVWKPSQQLIGGDSLTTPFNSCTSLRLIPAPKYGLRNAIKSMNPED